MHPTDDKELNSLKNKIFKSLKYTLICGLKISPIVDDDKNVAIDAADATMDVESWEEVKDVFFMLKLPINVDIDFDRFVQIVSRRRRKIGLCGASGQLRSGFVSLTEHVQEINSNE